MVHPLSRRNVMVLSAFALWIFVNANFTYLRFFSFFSFVLPRWNKQRSKISQRRIDQLKRSENLYARVMDSSIIVGNRFERCERILLWKRSFDWWKAFSGATVTRWCTIEHGDEQKGKKRANGGRWRVSVKEANWWKGLIRPWERTRCELEGLYMGT